MADTSRTKPFVLTVDDEERITELVAMALGFNGFDVERAAIGRQALAAIDQRRPDLILLDVMLPDLDGFEVARRLRQNEGAGAKVPIIFPTAKDATAEPPLIHTVRGVGYSLRLPPGRSQPESESMNCTDGQ